MELRIILFSAFGQDTELIAVMEIQSTQTADFSRSRQRAFEPIDLYLLCRLGKSGELYGIGVFTNTLHNSLVGVILSELV